MWWSEKKAKVGRRVSVCQQKMDCRTFTVVSECFQTMDCRTFAVVSECVRSLMNQISQVIDKMKSKNTSVERNEREIRKSHVLSMKALNLQYKGIRVFIPLPLEMKYYKLGPYTLL